MLAVALYFCTAFSFTQARVWAATRFAFVIAWRDRWRDWQDARARQRMQKELEKRRASKPAIQTQIIPARAATPAPISVREQSEPRRTGIERFAEEEKNRALTQDRANPDGRAFTQDAAGEGDRATQTEQPVE